MSSPPPSLYLHPPLSQGSERRSDSASDAESLDWWSLNNTALSASRTRPAPNSLASVPSLSALHSETLTFHTQKKALSSVLSATSPSDALSVNAIAALDVRLRSLILSMAQYNRVNPSPAEQQVVHAVLAVEETDKSVMSRMVSAAGHLNKPVDAQQPDYFHATRQDLDEFDQSIAGLRNVMSEPPPPCLVHKPPITSKPLPTPPVRWLSDTAGSAPLVRRQPVPLLPSTAATSSTRAPAAASFRAVQGWEDEAKEAVRTERGAADVWMRDEEKDVGADDFTATNKRKRAAQARPDEESRGRGRDRRGRGGEYDEEEKSFIGSDASKQPFMSGTAALALDAAKRGQLGGGGQQAQSGLSGARPSGLAGSKRKYVPPRPINAVPELAEAVPPMVRAALAGPSTASSYGDETDPIKIEKLKEYDPKLVEQVMRDALDNTSVNWSDIAGLVHAKQAITEVVVWPLKQPELFQGPRAPPKGMLLFGPPGTGKCFARGTRLRQYNGELIAVENIVGDGTELLMGDDGLPRIVAPGSLTHYDPRQKAAGEEEEEKLYRIAPLWDGASSFTVNGAHILVLANNQQPSMRQRSDGEWQVKEWELTTDNRMVERCCTFPTAARAHAKLDAIIAAGWQPLEWEVSVEEYLQASEEARCYCKLMACEAITFRNPQLPSLFDVLKLVHDGVPPSVDQVEYMAWWLGLWLADGSATMARVCQGEADASDPRHHHESLTRLLDYQQLFSEHVNPVHSHTSKAGWPVHSYDYGMDSVAGRVLQLYGLVGNKHVPRALICDSLDVRRRLMAGIIDGDGHYQPPPTNVYEIAAKHRLVIDGYKELAATLGLRNGAVRQHLDTNQQTGEQYHGYRLTISGDMWDVVQHCAATHKRCSPPGTVGYVETNKDSRCYGFTVTELPTGEYFGFAVHGGINRRFLLEDYTVTHNTMIGKAIAKEASAKFFAISASSLLSKWHGESEKLVRTLFAVARIYQPAVIFVDEIDSLLSQRGDSDAEASRRIKTELLVQMDGASNGTQESGRLLVLGATNRPQDLDEAARRRMEKRLYIPLPNRAARVELISHQLQLLDAINYNKHTLTHADIDRIAQLTHGYSGHDLANLCREASMVPMRAAYAEKTAALPMGGGLPQVELSEVPSVQVQHFLDMLERVMSSVDSASLKAYHEWNNKFGSFPSVVVDEE